MPSTPRLDCLTCGASSDWSDASRVTVPSSEREFERETFTVWRCPACECIHALDEVELRRYYLDYGLHRTTLGALERLFYRNQLRFIRRHARLDPSDPVLDFGCGSGIFVEFLRERGWAEVAGYDPYSATYADPGVLRRSYRLVLSTDVIDQVPSPADHLETVCAMVDPRAFLYLQMSDAQHVDLARPRASRQALHQPYRRHLLTTDWLAKAMAGHGFHAVAERRRPYFHTRIPFLNLPTIDWYLDRHGGLVALNEPFRWSTLLRPGLWYRGLTGGLASRTDEVQLIFRRAG